MTGLGLSLHFRFFLNCNAGPHRGVCFCVNRKKKVLKCDHWRSHPQRLSCNIHLTVFFCAHTHMYTQTGLRLSLSDTFLCSHKELIKRVLSYAHVSDTQTHTFTHKCIQTGNPSPRAEYISDRHYSCHYHM